MKIPNEVVDKFYRMQDALEQKIESMVISDSSYIDVPYHAPGVYARWDCKTKRFTCIVARGVYDNGNSVDARVILKTGQ